VLETLAGDGFQKSHSDAYAVIRYYTAYLKAHFPVDFMAALLSCDSGNADQITDLIDEATLMGISIQGRDILKSREALTPDVEESNGYILFGLSAIKGPYVDVMDFMGRIDVRVVSKQVLEVRIFSVAFDGVDYHRKDLLEYSPTAMQEASTMQHDASMGQMQLCDKLGPAAKGSRTQISTISNPMSN
jgi:DNA polymerase-3 subunit alpha